VPQMTSTTLADMKRLARHELREATDMFDVEPAINRWLRVSKASKSRMVKVAAMVAAVLVDSNSGAAGIKCRDLVPTEIMDAADLVAFTPMDHASELEYIERVRANPLALELTLALLHDMTAEPYAGLVLPANRRMMEFRAEDLVRQLTAA
jgi:hypothetical protein